MEDLPEDIETKELWMEYLCSLHDALDMRIKSVNFREKRDQGYRDIGNSVKLGIKL